jgi:putative two-component system response regulator
LQKLVFVVDDNDSNLTMAAAALENDFRVLTMPSAEKMFSLLEKVCPDLILLDVEMPTLNGVDALLKLKADSKRNDIPVVFLTGLSEEEIEAFKNKAFETGALDIIRKPFDFNELLEKAKEYIRK